MRVLDGVGHVLQARYELAARDEAQVDAVEVAEHGDVQSGAFDRWSERKQRDQSRAAEVQRERRPGHVGDHEVDRDRPAAREPAEQPARQSEDARTGELAELQERARADRLVFLFRTLRRITDVRDLRLDVFEVLLRLKPKLVAFTHVSNTLGTINLVAEMTEMAHAAGALVLIDGAQAVPHVPVDVQAIGADFYAFSGHKMLGPTGSGALWARRELLEAMPPFLAGGEMIREVHLRRSDFNDIPWKFEAGTPDIAAAIGFGAAAEYLMTLGMDRVREHERELTAYALDTLASELPWLELYGPMHADLRGGVVPFNVPGVHPHDVAQVLDRYGIAVRAGHHCTMPLHERLDLAATARASFNVYSVREDVDALIEGLREVVKLFGEPVR